MVDEHELPGELLDDLRGVWKAKRPATSVDELGEDLGGQDLRSQRAIGWMRSAWREMEIPEPRVPTGRVLRPRFARAINVVASLAAALLLALLAYSVAMKQDPVAPLAPTEPPRGPHVAAIGDNHIELRSGPVTLILVTSEAVSGLDETADPRTLEDG